MRPRSDNQRASLEVQALYSIAALARIGNVSTPLLLRVLRANGVTFVRARRALFVPLTEIQRKIPPLWESLCAAAQLRQDAAEGERPVRAKTRAPQG